MRARPFDPRHLDIAAFAEKAAVLEGDLPLGQLQRLCDSAHAEAPPAADEFVRWRAVGERRAAAGAQQQNWLQLRAHTTLRLTCQRCLQAVACPLSLDSEFRFVGDETTAAAIDIDAEEDVLVESRSFNLFGLIEDELLLALPLVPRHEGRCPQPLRAPPDPAAAAMAAAPQDKPFAALAGLKVRKTAG